LDFCCGKGRNVRNLARLADWGSVDGVDISIANTTHCKKDFSDRAIINGLTCSHNFYLSSGVDAGKAPLGIYHFVTSTIVLQHIPVYTIRKRLLSSIRDLLAPGDKLALQMGLGKCDGLGPQFQYSLYH
jgi:SAM-dependent methyltransferase